MITRLPARTAREKPSTTKVVDVSAEELVGAFTLRLPVRRPLEQNPHKALVDRLEDRFLGRKVVVEAGLLDSDRRGYLADACAVVPALVEQAHRDIEDLLAAHVAVQSSSRALAGSQVVDHSMSYRPDGSPNLANHFGGASLDSSTYRTVD